MLGKLTLIAKHLWLDASDTRRAIPPELSRRLTALVAASEQRHNGQIRLCIESSLPASYLWRLGRGNTLAGLIRQRAVMMFGKLRVWDTEHNNGVLIYLLLGEHAIEIVADRGLKRPVDDAQWQAMLARMGSAFKEEHYEAGLTLALEEISSLLVTHFARTDDVLERPNELPDTPLLQ